MSGMLRKGSTCPHCGEPLGDCFCPKKEPRNRIVITTRRRLEEQLQKAWSEGYNLGEDEVNEFIAEKDAFIAQQAALLAELAESNEYVDWTKLPGELKNRLADYL